MYFGIIIALGYNLVSSWDKLIPNEYFSIEIIKIISYVKNN